MIIRISNRVSLQTAAFGGKSAKASQRAGSLSTHLSARPAVDAGDQVALSPSAAGSRGGRKERQEGDISAVFASLSNEKPTPLPGRFGALKRGIIGDEANQAALIQGWERLLVRLSRATEEIEGKQQDCIPQTTYDELINGPSPTTLQSIKRAGSLVVRSVVDQSTAEGWLESVQAYIARNPSVRGFPKDDKQVFELYWSKAQLAARSHPRSMAVQRALLSLFSSTSASSSKGAGSGSIERLGVSPIPMTYADRLRIRHPGDAQFALGPHADGGSVERWEDPVYRSVYERILVGGLWEEFDAFDGLHKRVVARQNLYDGAGSCGVFRAFQGWTSLSDTGPGEGTLQVYPLVKELTAYMMLRPLFREKHHRSTLTRQAYLAAENWELDPESTDFPGSPLARCQEFNDFTHPHLELDRTMISMPRVRPGDQAWWHCDVIHAVEAVHNGPNPSAVLYIPAVPLTVQNAEYLRDQREVFLAGRPGPDFPGGVGESLFDGRGVIDDVVGADGRRAMGLEPFEISQELSAAEAGVRRKANQILDF